MMDFMQTYVDQVNEINALMSRTELTPEPGQDLIGRIRQRSERVYHLLQANNAIVQQQLLPLLAPETTLTPDEHDALNDFAAALCTFSAYIDAAMAFRVHQKLLACAKQWGDDEQIIRQQYDLGISAYLLFSAYEIYKSINVRDRVVPWFEQNAAYLDRLPQLSSTARRFVLRSLNNEALVFNHKRYDQIDDYMRIIRRTKQVFTDPAVRALEPELNWDAFVRAVYRNSLRISDAIEHGHGLEYISDVQEAAAWLTDRTDVSGEAVAELDQYSALELEYILHRLSDAELVTRLDAIYARRDPLLFDDDGIDQNISIPAFSFLYEVHLHPPSIARINDKIDAIVRYVNAFHHQTGLYSYTYAVVNFINYYPDLPGVTPFRHVLEELLLALHVPTYVHSLMVSNLSALIAETLLDTCPECFIGLHGIRTAQDAVSSRAAILDFVRYAGLFHDVGKFSCIDVITQYSRRLFDDEFSIIKLHARCGYELLSAHASTAPFAEVALMHHITYDRAGGYAKEFLPLREAVPMVSDIVRIADATDAATDNIGRCYSACKDQAAIMAELADSPKSYNPVMMAALMTPAAQAALHQVLDQTRGEIYARAYTFAPDEPIGCDAAG